MAYASKMTAKTRAEQYAKVGELPKMSIADTRDCLRQSYDELNEYKKLGYCYMCDTFKRRDNFYISTDPRIRSGICPICKDCAEALVMRRDENGHDHEPTKESLQLGLRYLNKIYTDDLWNMSVRESSNEISGKTRGNVWKSYVKNMQLTQFYGYTFWDSDFFKKDNSSSTPIFYDDEQEQAAEYHLSTLSNEEVDEFTKNKNDVVRLIGFDPFSMELPQDQPYLYSQLLGMLDSGGEQNDDMMRTQSCISICRGFLQASKIDNSITTLMADIKNIESNSASIKSLQESKKSIMGYITQLAKESQISLSSNKSMAQKGANTWTGKMKKIKDLDLRDGRINGFDIETCKAMRQVADLSNSSILQMLNLDDSEWADMVAEQRDMIIDLRNRLDSYIEISRILLTENLDLKDFINRSDLKLDGFSFVDLESLFFGIEEEKEREEEIEDEPEKNEQEEFIDENSGA